MSIVASHHTIAAYFLKGNRIIDDGYGIGSEKTEPTLLGVVDHASSRWPDPNLPASRFLS